MTKFYFKTLSRILFLLIVTTGLAIGQNTLTGTVTDAGTGEAIAGANVVIKGTTQGTVCDANGTFSLSVPSGTETLIVSFIGYRTQEIGITSSTSSISVKLEEDKLVIEELR